LEKCQKFEKIQLQSGDNLFAKFTNFEILGFGLEVLTRSRYQRSVLTP